MKLEQRLKASVFRRSGEILLRRDFAALGSTSQVSLALRHLVGAGRLVRLGEGVYAKASTASTPETPCSRVPFVQLLREYFEREGIEATVEAATDTREEVLVNITGRRGRHLRRRLALGGQRAVYVKLRVKATGTLKGPGGRIASHRGGSRPSVRMLRVKLTGYRAEVAEKVAALAKKYQVSYAQSALDTWAAHVTRLAGDDTGAGDPVKETLRALQRAGKISRADMFKMMMEYVTGRRIV